MQTLPLSLTPGQDLRHALEAAVRGRNCHAAFVLSGIGSLADAHLRLAGAAAPQHLPGNTKILSLSGTVAFDGRHSRLHLHMALATASGAVVGVHVAPACIVRTTAEVLLALLPDWAFTRAPDAATGYDELVIHARARAGDTPAEP